MSAIIIAVGNELTGGQTVETNGAYLARRLGARGIEVAEHRTVGDHRDAIAEAISQSARRADLVIVSGGLGPTTDDLTRQATAEAMGVALVPHAGSLARIERFFDKLGRTMAPANRVQAMIPAGAEALANEVGTAPGIAAVLGGAQVFVVPGVPAEMKWMFANCVEPRLPAGRSTIVHRIVHAFGLGESDVGERISDLMARDANPTVGTTVAAGMVSMRVVARDADVAAAQRLAKRTIDEIARRLGPLIVGLDTGTMASAIGENLRLAGQTLSTAESCTGGLIGEMITAVGGASDYYLGGIVAYSNALKQRLLSIPADLIARNGAVSEPVAAAMAAACRQKAASDWAIGITGIAGPAGGSPDKPVGLVYIALAGADATAVHRHVFGGGRETVRLRAALTAMNYLRLELLRGD